MATGYLLLAHTFLRERNAFAVSDLLFSFAVTVVGHRKVTHSDNVHVNTRAKANPVNAVREDSIIVRSERVPNFIEGPGVFRDRNIRVHIGRSRISISSYNFTETVCWLSRNLRKSLALLRWSCQQFIHEFQCHCTKYFNFTSVDLRTIFALTLGNLPTGDKQSYEHFGSTN